MNLLTANYDESTHREIHATCPSSLLANRTYDEHKRTTRGPQFCDTHAYTRMLYTSSLYLFDYFCWTISFSYLRERFLCASRSAK